MLARGTQIREARRAEVTAILSDLAATSITSGSSVTISSTALIRPFHNSTNNSAPGYSSQQDSSKAVSRYRPALLKPSKLGRVSNYSKSIYFKEYYGIGWV
jgi:hypothetical protein